MKKLLLIVVVLAVLSGIGLGVVAWRTHVTRATESRAFDRAKELIKEGRPHEALTLAQSFGGRPDSHLAWDEVEFEVYVLQLNFPKLTSIFQRDPDRILKHEEASLAIARAFLHLRQTVEFEKVRGRWKGKETTPDRWLILDVDRLLLSGEPGKALALLATAKFPGTNDVPRLLRLAVLTAPRNATESFRLLNQAVKLSPRSSDARAFRGQVLETLNRFEEARVEYVAAVVAEPGNPIWRDQLGEYYRRRHSYDLALATFRDSLAPPSLDSLWLKAEFWSRVIQPIDSPNRTHAIPKGALAPVVQLLKDLPAGRFFDTNLAAAIPGSSRLAHDRHEVRWLWIADRLQAGDEKGAFETLAGPRPGGPSWESDLERALLRILAWRMSPTDKQTLIPRGTELPRPAREGDSLPAFFRQLDQFALAQETPGQGGSPMPAEFKTVLEGPHVFVAAFLAAGWREAALRLAAGKDPGPEVPSWLSYGYAQALRYNRGTPDALKFLSNRTPDPSLQMLAGELALAEGKADEGFEKLSGLATRNDDLGYRAAWLMALASLDRKRTVDAVRFVSGQPRLATNLTGLEIKARVAMLEGNTNEADRLYRGVVDQSVEARLHLSRRAFARKEWDLARKLTLELMELMPDRLELRANLEAIAKAAAAAP